MTDPISTAVWVMIAVTAMGYGGTNVTTQEFTSRDRCEIAAETVSGMIKSYGGGKAHSIRCVAK